MADTVKTEQILKLEYYFVDGDTRTQVVNYGRSDVTTTEIRELQSLIRANNLLIGDKNQATFGKISSVTYTDRQTTTTDAERPLGIIPIADVVDTVYLLYIDANNNQVIRTYDVVDGAVTIPYADTNTSGSNPTVIGFVINPATERQQLPITVSISGTTPARDGNSQSPHRGHVKGKYDVIYGFFFYRMNSPVTYDQTTETVLSVDGYAVTVTITGAPTSVSVDKSQTYATAL